MYPALLRSLFAGLTVLGLFGAATPDCGAWQDADLCCCRYWPHDWKIIDCYTRCAWKRTWHSPNALATPLRQYYIPRPPACCWSGGGANGCGYAGEGSFDSFDYLKCQCQNDTAGLPVTPPDADHGFSPVGFERLGQVRNELDLGGALPGAPARAPGSAR